MEKPTHVLVEISKIEKILDSLKLVHIFNKQTSNSDDLIAINAFEEILAQADTSSHIDNSVVKNWELHRNLTRVAHHAVDSFTNKGRKRCSRKELVASICTAIQSDSVLVASITPVAEPKKQEPVMQTETQKDADRYRWLFNDVDLLAIKKAHDKGVPLPPNFHSALIAEIIGRHYNKFTVDLMVDAAMTATAQGLNCYAENTHCLNLNAARTTHETQKEADRRGL